jgi:hypothetical protein
MPEDIQNWAADTGGSSRADGRRADPVRPHQRLPMDLASLFPGRPHSAQPRPHVSGNDQERGRRPARACGTPLIRTDRGRYILAE